MRVKKNQPEPQSSLRLLIGLYTSLFHGPRMVQSPGSHADLFPKGKGDITNIWQSLWSRARTNQGMVVCACHPRTQEFEARLGYIVTTHWDPGLKSEGGQGEVWGTHKLNVGLSTAAGTWGPCTSRWTLIISRLWRNRWRGAFEEWPGVWRTPRELWKLFTNQSRNIPPTLQFAHWCQYMPTIRSSAQRDQARTEMRGWPWLSSCPPLIRAHSSPSRT